MSQCQPPRMCGHGLTLWSDQQCTAVAGCWGHVLCGPVNRIVRTVVWLSQNIASHHHAAFLPSSSNSHSSLTAMQSASTLKKQAALLSNLTHSIDLYETERKRAAPPPRSNYHTAQPTIAFLRSVQPTLNSLIALQPPFPPPSAPTTVLSDRIEQFGGWLKSVAPACGIGERWELQAAGEGGEEGNGVVATRMLSPSSLLMTIPRRAILWATSFADKSSAYHSADAAAFAAVLFDMRDPMLTGMPSLLLALLLMFERQRGTASPLHAYLDVLPTHFSLPLFAIPDELQCLSHNPALLSVVNLQYNTIMQYVYLHRLLTTARLLQPATPNDSATRPFASSGFTFGWQQFRWAISVMYTRQNRVSDALCLIPGWDMCNHRAAIGSIHTFYDVDDKASTTYTADDAVVEAGEAVHIYYGDRSNRDLFVYSGFIDPHNASRDYVLVWTDDVQNAIAAAGSYGVADWSRIKGLMRKKAGVDGAATVKLPLPFRDTEWEEERLRRRQEREKRRVTRQQAWQRWEQASGEKRNEAVLKQNVDEDEQAERMEAEQAESAERSNDERLTQLLSLLRIEALQTKEEAMDALRLQSGTGGPVGQLNSANELRARQLLLRWLQYEQRLYGDVGMEGVERQVKELEAVGAIEQSTQRRVLMLRVQLEGLQLLRDAEHRVERWIAAVGAVAIK